MKTLRENQARLEARLETLIEEQRQTENNLRDVTHGLVHLRDNDQHEREKMLLQLKNELHPFERRLPPNAPE